jgi:hypothetical protein
MNIKNLLIAGSLVFFISFNASPSYANAAMFPQHQRAATAEKFLRTELYFGMDISDGGTVSDDEWSEFLETQVTPKFPEGFTVVEAYGQFRERDGTIGKEKSRMLILLYPKKMKADANVNIDAIRAAYVKQFRQKSVMRMDLPQSVLVSF